MGTYGLKEVVFRWGRGMLTVEQAIGQILLLLQAIEERLRDLEHKRSAPEGGACRKGVKKQPS